MSISNKIIGNKIIGNKAISHHQHTYSPSDWAILNHASLERLHRLLADQLSPTDLNRACQLLTAYWSVYRANRLKHKLTKPCAEPTEAQLQRMVTYLETKGIIGYTLQSMLQDLRDLAQRLRHANVR